MFGQPTDAAWRCGLANVLPFDGTLALERFIKLFYLQLHYFYQGNANPNLGIFAVTF